jgi:type I restriction enzyme S subunit
MSLVSAKIEDVCLVGDGAHASIKRVSEGVPYLTSKNFKKDGLDLSKLDYISKEDYDKHFNGKSKAITKPIFNDIMLSIIGSIGSPHLVRNNDEFGLSSSVSILRPNEVKILPAFLYYWLKSDFFQQSIQQIKSGVAQSFLSLGMIKSLPVNYFESLTTQKRIADILSAYDDLIENNLKRIKLLEQAAQNIYKEWFVNLRFPGYENTPVNEETELPEGWGNGVVSDLCEVKSGFAFKSKHWKKEGNPVMKIKNIKNNTVDIDNSDFVDNDVAGLAKKYELFPGDVIIAMTGATVGKVGLIPKIGKRIYLNQRVGLFRPLTEENDNIALVFSFFLTDDSQQQVLNFAQGAAQPNISGSEIGNIKLNIADSKVLSEFNKLTKPSIDLIQTLYGQNQKLKAARDILLPRLMNRTIEV